MACRFYPMLRPVAARTIDREVPKRLEVHLILDHYATYNQPNVRTWLTQHPRFELHFAGLELMAEHIRELLLEAHRQAIRRGIFHSGPDLFDAIQAYRTAHNENVEPFQRTATTNQILDTFRRGRASSSSRLRSLFG